MLGILYIVFQIMGAIFGELLAFNFLKNTRAIGLIEYPGADGATWYWSQAMFQETLGSAILVFLYLTQTEGKTRLSTDPAITMLIISAGYLASMTIGLNGGRILVSPVNPAIAIGNISSSILKGTYDYNWAWIFMVFPLIGAMLGLFTFEVVFKKTHGALEGERACASEEGDGNFMDEAVDGADEGTNRLLE